jgi:hypothetical protein
MLHLFQLYYNCHMWLLCNLLTKSNMIDRNHIYIGIHLETNMGSNFSKVLNCLLNQHMKMDPYPMPLMEDMHRQLSKQKM